MPTAADLLRALDGALGRLGCRWYVFGAQALAVHGRARHTEDVDVTVELDPARIRSLLTGLQDAGFASRVEDPEDFLRHTHVLPLTFSPPNEPGEFEEEFTITVAGRPEPIVLKATGTIIAATTAATAN